MSTPPPMLPPYDERMAHPLDPRVNARGTIERQATNLRSALIRVADGSSDQAEVLRMTQAIREQLALAGSGPCGSGRCRWLDRVVK